MPFIIFIVAIIIIVNASKSNKNPNNNPNNFNTKNPNTYGNPVNRNIPQNPANIQNNPQDLKQLKERLSSKYGTPQNTNRMPQNRQKPVHNTAPKKPVNNTVTNRENSRQKVIQDIQQPNVSPNINKPQAKNIPDYLSLGTTNTLVLTEAPSSLMMGISDYDFSYWGIGVDKYEYTGEVIK